MNINITVVHAIIHTHNMISPPLQLLARMLTP